MFGTESDLQEPVQHSRIVSRQFRCVDKSAINSTEEIW